MKRVLSTIGAAVLIFWLLSIVGVGHFQLYYGAERWICTPETTPLPTKETAV